MGKFLDHVAAHRLGGCFGLTLLGLRWSDVDLETGALRIRQARIDVNGRDTIVPTKTDRSARDLPLPPRELAMIKAMRAVHLRERLAVGRPLADADLLLSRADGTWLLHQPRRRPDPSDCALLISRQPLQVLAAHVKAGPGIRFVHHPQQPFFLGDDLGDGELLVPLAVVRLPGPR